MTTLELHSPLPQRPPDQRQGLSCALVLCLPHALIPHTRPVIFKTPLDSWHLVLSLAVTSPATPRNEDS